MSNEIKNGKLYVQWSVMVILLAMLASILGVMWSEIRSAREGTNETRESVARIRTDVDWSKKLIERGEVSILRK